MSVIPERMGRYQILGEIATGGMAEILLARVVGPSGFQRPVVIKRILPHLARQPQFVTMFLDEARIVAGIRHPCVVHVEELAQEGGELFLAMEYLEGETAASLQRALAARGDALPRELGAHIIAEACAGLHAAHELVDSEGMPQRLVHRDVSPENLFVTYDGSIKVIDFGIATAADRVTRTETGELKGKIAYMSPEQCEARPVDRRSDVFALGVVLYELTTGRRLFKRGSPIDTIRAICQEPIVPPARLFTDYPATLEKVCLRALERSVTDRYQTAKQMRDELLAAAAGSGSQSCPDEIAKIMRDIFADRITDKRAFLRSVSSGVRSKKAPPAKGRFVSSNDIGVSEAPIATDATLRSGLSSGASRAGLPAALGVRAAVVASAVLAVLSLVVMTGMRMASRAPTQIVAVAPVAAATSFPGSDPAPVVRGGRLVTMHVETQPTGAHVRIAGVDQGVTPVSVTLPAGSAPIPIAIELTGFASVERAIVPEVDRDILLSLSPLAVRARSPARPPSSQPAALPSASSSPWSEKWH